MLSTLSWRIVLLLVSLVIVYLVLGGLIFWVVEKGKTAETPEATVKVSDVTDQLIGKYSNHTDHIATKFISRP